MMILFLFFSFKQFISSLFYKEPKINCWRKTDTLFGENNQDLSKLYVHIVLRKWKAWRKIKKQMKTNAKHNPRELIW